MGARLVGAKNCGLLVPDFAALVRLHSPQHQQFHAHVLMPLARAADATRAHALLPQRKGCSPAASGAL